MRTFLKLFLLTGFMITEKSLFAHHGKWWCPVQEHPYLYSFGVVALSALGIFILRYIYRLYRKGVFGKYYW